MDKKVVMKNSMRIAMENRMLEAFAVQRFVQVNDLQSVHKDAVKNQAFDLYVRDKEFNAYVTSCVNGIMGILAEYIEFR